jgi:soluble lytic murein transglycosylase-like protein
LSVGFNQHSFRCVSGAPLARALLLATILGLVPSAAADAQIGVVTDPDSIRSAAVDNGVDPGLVTAVIAAESNFDPRALSPKGAQGLMQLMPATADDLGVRDVWNPDDNIRGGTAHLARLLGKYDDDASLALAAYNAGEGTVDRHGGVPPFRETQQYVSRVLGYYRSYRESND